MSAERQIPNAKVGLAHAREILKANGNLTAEVEQLCAFVEGQHVGRHGRGREALRSAA